MGIKASNNISESLHAMSTRSLQQCTTIRLDHAAAEGQSQSNDDMGRDHTALITRRGGEEDVERDFGFFHRLDPKIRTALIVAGKRMSKQTRKLHDDALKICKEKRLNKMKLAQQKNAEAKGEAYIDALDYIEQYWSDRCWKSEEVALEQYELIDSGPKRLKAVKEQITIRRKGFGWEDLAHKWSEGGYVYSSKELLDHLIDVILPAEQTREIPTEPTVGLYMVNNEYTLGTTTTLNIDERFNAMSSEEFRQKMTEERERRETERETDRAAQLQRNVMPEFNQNLVGFKIEFCFTYIDDEDGSEYPAWCDGVIESIVNERLRTVMIRWNADKVADGDQLVSRHPLLKSCWNPRNPKQNAWREHINDLDS